MITHRNLGSHLNIWYRHGPALDQCCILSDISNVFHGRFLMTNLTFVLMTHSVKCCGRIEVFVSSFQISGKWEKKGTANVHIQHLANLSLLLGFLHPRCSLQLYRLPAGQIVVPAAVDPTQLTLWDEPPSSVRWQEARLRLQTRHLLRSPLTDRALLSKLPDCNHRPKMSLQPLHELASCNNILYNGTDGVTSKPHIPLHIFIAFFSKIFHSSARTSN
jgi:hypothetical protein